MSLIDDVSRIQALLDDFSPGRLGRPSTLENSETVL